VKTAGVIVALAAAVSAQAQPSALTILSSKCLACHGAARMSDLDLRDRAAALKGGKRGPAIVPGSSGSSLLYQAVKRDTPLQMPPGKDALTAEEIEALKKWIDAGAPWSAGAGLEGGGWWSFQKPVHPQVPPGKPHPIDAFLEARRRQKGLSAASQAGRGTLARRAYFDLHGLPPTPEQVDEFVNDASPESWKQLIDRLLASPRYGERWGRYWLDLVRYADTSGFETDHFYVSAWRYRDYVIESFNKDKPYDVFIKEQIAADEIWGTDVDLEGILRMPEAKAENLKRRIGTSLFTMGAFPIEYTYYGDQYRAEWASEAVDVVGSAFLGMTLACARCHDHKFDPVSQRDYYRLAAMFAGSSEREIPLGSLFDVQTATRGFPLLAHAEAMKRMVRNMKRGEPGSEAEAKRDEMLKRLGEAYLRAPERAPTAIVIGHDETIRPTHVLKKGEWQHKGELVKPGFPAALGPGPEVKDRERRKALAEWLASADHPLVARVMVNRIWQGHFSHGLVRTPNDFGRQGDAPTHPELLDWLATEFVARKFSIKEMHRLLMTSEAYRMSSVAPKGSAEKDPENLYLSHMNRRRLDGDAIRDSILAAAGTLNLRMGGVGVIPPLTKEEIQAARMPDLWPANPDPSEHNRRSVYLQMKRSLTLPMLQTFDAPDTSQSCARRETSTVAPQALALMNSEFTAKQAAALARRVGSRETPGTTVDAVWRVALGRLPSDQERATAVEYLNKAGLERLCLMVLNLNEFLYVD
jgi:cytochrome c553